MTAWETTLKTLNAEGIGGPLTYRHSRTSSVTTSWGVDWDDEFIARDLLQNFYDANREHLAEVKVAVQGHTVTVSAPAPMELERLFYLGSEKGDEDIGKYGEGFKVAAVCLLRDHNIEPIVTSQDQVLYIRMDREQVSGTQLRPLVYDFFTAATPCPGTRLILRGCSLPLIRALEAGLSHFFHDRNPLLGPKLWASWNEQFAIYRATTPDGHVFYRRLRRGRIPDLPVVLVIEKQFERIEKKTRRDRDPRDPPAQARRVQRRRNRGPPGRTQAAPPVRVGAGVPFGPGLCERLRRGGGGLPARTRPCLRLRRQPRVHRRAHPAHRERRTLPQRPRPLRGPLGRGSGSSSCTSALSGQTPTPKRRSPIGSAP
ncbi:MAG: hypothetical protein M5U12_12660 [Verrucomicrobia bacterium]|nr:hypothetical protein [Verrucomicrobiota bacterium]